MKKSSRGRPPKSSKTRRQEKALWRERCKAMQRPFPPLDKSGNIPDYSLTRLRVAWKKHEAAQDVAGEM